MTLHKLDDSYRSYFLVGCHRLPETERSKQSCNLCVADVLAGSFLRKRKLRGKREFFRPHSESWVHISCCGGVGWGGVGGSDSLKTPGITLNVKCTQTEEI